MVIPSYALVGPPQERLRVYTFTPIGNDEVEVKFYRLALDIVVVVPAQEARDLWSRLLKRGYVRR